MRLKRGSQNVVLVGLTGLLLTLSVGCSMPAPPRQRGGREGDQEGGRREIGEGPGGRRQSLALNPQQELETGKRAYAEVMKEYGKRTLPKSSPEVARVVRIVERLAKAAAIEPLQREINLRIRGYRFEWAVSVVHDDQINAFCLPAGKMVVFTGILKLAGNNDDFVATVLSHEMSHALAHHASERVARAQTHANILSSLTYDRMQEAEADHIGVFLMAFAGYDPRAAVAFWERMSKVHGGKAGKPEFLSDHPSDANRVRALRGEAEMAIKAKAAYRPKRESPSNGDW
jgi:metalloendopeptidase OMA1, mitochondrial